MDRERVNRAAAGLIADHGPHAALEIAERRMRPSPQLLDPHWDRSRSGSASCLPRESDGRGGRALIPIKTCRARSGGGRL
jgi:hypothetical protein